MPAVFPCHLGKAPERFIAAGRREAVRINPGPFLFPGHNNGGDGRVQRFRRLFQKGDCFFIRLEAFVWLHRAFVNSALDTENDMDR